MNDAMIELGQRAVACERWEWVPGMRYVTPQGAAGRWVMLPNWEGNDGRVFGPCREDEYHHSLHEDKVPDLTDAATLGCLIDLVHRAYNYEAVTTDGNTWWAVETPTGRWDDDNTDSFAEALVCALEAVA